MINIAKLFAIILSLVLTGRGVKADDKIVLMTAMDWPPYTIKDLPGQGISSQVVAAVFAELGYELKIEFLPWQRSLIEPIQSERYAGTFPVYHTVEREKVCLFSRPIGSSPLGFVQHKNKPARWERFEDLKGFRIGTVMEYSNTAAFDALADDGTLDVSSVPSDFHYLRRLVFNRIDLAVIDQYVMRYLIGSKPLLKKHRDKLEFNAKPIENRDLYVCFKNNAWGEVLKEAFNGAFQAEDAKRITEDAMAKLGYR